MTKQNMYNFAQNETFAQKRIGVKYKVPVSSTSILKFDIPCYKPITF